MTTPPLHVRFESDCPAGSAATDPRTEALKSAAFFGRRFTRRQIADIAETVAMLPNDSRNELSKTVCGHLGWTTPKGGCRVSACLRVLERLEECGVLTLPALLFLSICRFEARWFSRFWLTSDFLETGTVREDAMCPVGNCYWG